jgi:hypothetical protein
MPVNLQPEGVVLAVVTFAAIGAGHVLVRGLHARFDTRPALPFFLAGLLTLAASVAANDDLLSAILGITAVTLIWDGVEIFRQEKRLKQKPG